MPVPVEKWRIVETAIFYPCRLNGHATPSITVVLWLCCLYPISCSIAVLMHSRDFCRLLRSSRGSTGFVNSNMPHLATILTVYRHGCHGAVIFFSLSQEKKSFVKKRWVWSVWSGFGHGNGNIRKIEFAYFRKYIFFFFLNMMNNHVIFLVNHQESPLFISSRSNRLSSFYLT